MGPVEAVSSGKVDQPGDDTILEHNLEHQLMKRPKILNVYIHNSNSNTATSGTYYWLWWYNSPYDFNLLCDAGILGTFDL